MYSRSDRLQELFREEVVTALRGVKDPGLSGFLTVTGVELSPDKKTLRVFYSIMGSEHDKHSAAKALDRAAPFIRQVLRKRVSIKMIPQVVFVYDGTPEKASRIDKMFLKLEDERQREQ
jgi:ribosome-binding factor A